MNPRGGAAAIQRKTSSVDRLQGWLHGAVSASAGNNSERRGTGDVCAGTAPSWRVGEVERPPARNWSAFLGRIKRLKQGEIQVVGSRSAHVDGHFGVRQLLQVGRCRRAAAQHAMKLADQFGFHTGMPRQEMPRPRPGVGGGLLPATNCVIISSRSCRSDIPAGVLRYRLFRDSGSSGKSAPIGADWTSKPAFLRIGKSIQKMQMSCIGIHRRCIHERGVRQNLSRP